MSEVACRYVGIDLGAWACASPTLGRRSTTFHSSDSLTLFCLSVFSFCNVVSERVRMEAAYVIVRGMKRFLGLNILEHFP
jgi:hypothetical protein